MFPGLTFRLPNGFSTVLLSFLLITISCSAPRASSLELPSEKHLPEPGIERTKGETPIRYIVQLMDPPLLGYDGGISGLAATNPAITGHGLDQQSPEARAYLAYLSEKQARFKKIAEQLLAKKVEFNNRFSITLNAVVMTITPDEARKVSNLPDVRSVEPDRQLKPQSKFPDNGQKASE